MKCRDVVSRADGADGIEQAQAVAATLVKAFHIDVQRIAQAFEFLGLGPPLLGIGLATAGPSRLQLRQHVELSGFARVQLQAELAQADFTQAPVDDIQRRDLLGYEEDASALCQGLGDQVGDGLALAVPGGPIRTKSLPCEAASTADNCEESAGKGQNTCLGSKCWSSSRTCGNGAPSG